MDHLLPTQAEDIIKDAKMLSTKKKVMGSLRWNSVLNSVSKAAALIAGPLIASALVAGLPATLGAMTNFSLAGIGSALAAGFSMPIAMTLAVGAVFAVAAIGADYAASRIWQSKQFDNYEITAQSTAKHLVEEIKSHNMCMTEHEVTSRADGKSWSQYVDDRKSTQPGQSL